MAWRSTCPMDERCDFILDLLSDAYTMSQLCALYGVSRKTGYKWLHRFFETGIQGLSDRTRAPHTNPRAVTPEVAELIVQEREAHPHWGAAKLLARLSERHPNTSWPARSTCHDILVRARKVEPRRRRRSAQATDTNLFDPDIPNAVWAVDFKGEFRLGDGSLCYPLTITDSYSRYLLGCYALPSTATQAVQHAFELLFETYGLPEVIRSDNGAPFASTGAGRLTRLSVWWIKLGIQLDRTRPGHPQDNGRHERFHRTLKAEATRPPSYRLEAQADRFESFRILYNEERPHQALNQEVPGRHYLPSTRTYQSDPKDPVYPGHWESRRVKGSGEIRWRGKNWFLSQPLAGELVGLFEADHGIWKIAFASHPVAVYDAQRGLIRPFRSGLKTRPKRLNV